MALPKVTVNVKMASRLLPLGSRRSARQINVLMAKATSCAIPPLRNIPKETAGFGVASFHQSTMRLNSKHFNEAVATEDDIKRDEGPLLTDLRKRGLYSDYRYGHYHKYTIEDLAISDDKKTLTINWNDGHTSEFDAIWLRHNCHCKDCKHDTNGMVKIKWHSLPSDICVFSAELEGDKMVVFQWGTPDGQALHHGIIPTATLRCYCYSKKSIRERRERRTMHFPDKKVIPEVQFEEFQAMGSGFHKGLGHINEQGLCIVKNVPCDKESFLNTARLIGPILPTIYGDTFDVVPSPNPINAAYSSNELALHMDLPFYEIPPGLQILHCWSFDRDVVGGSNTFVDIHEVAHQFRRECPEFFDRLARLPATFNSIHYNRAVPVHMENQKPMFSLNHYGELVAVTYHPMVMGPTELPKEDMVAFYEAYTAFYKMVTEFESKFTFTFDVGDFVVFNNRRVLHGREAFTGKGRHLMGTYIDLSNFHSHIQALHNKHGDGRLASRSGSHSWF